MYILFQVNYYDIKLYGTEEPIYIGDTVELRCTLRTNNRRAIKEFSLGCRPCWRGNAAQTLSQSRIPDITWDNMGNGVFYTELRHQWIANEASSPLILCEVWWNGPKRVDSKNDKQYLNITGTY